MTQVQEVLDLKSGLDGRRMTSKKVLTSSGKCQLYHSRTLWAKELMLLSKWSSVAIASESENISN